jgi:hypothetical protein
MFPGYVDIILYWCAELVPKFCRHLSVTFCIYRNIYSMHIKKLRKDVIKTFYAFRPACDRVGILHITRSHFWTAVIALQEAQWERQLFYAARSDNTQAQLCESAP